MSKFGYRRSLFLDEQFYKKIAYYFFYNFYILKIILFNSRTINRYLQFKYSNGITGAWIPSHHAEFNCNI